MSLPETPPGGLHKGQGRDADVHKPQARPCSVLALWMGASVSWTPMKGGPGYLNYFTSGSPLPSQRRRRRRRPLKSEACVSILSGKRPWQLQAPTVPASLRAGQQRGHRGRPKLWPCPLA